MSKKVERVLGPFPTDSVELAQGMLSFVWTVLEQRSFYNKDISPNGLVRLPGSLWIFGPEKR